jgi:hypothetical protein
MAEIVIIAPELNPGAGGVGDYTLRLLEALPLSEERLLVPQIDRSGSASRQYRVEKLGRDRRAILEQLPGSGGKLLVQYSAYGFDHLGYPRHLLAALVDWKNATRGRLVVMFHEIWTFWPVTNKNFFVQLFHQRAIKRLLEYTDVVLTSTSSQAEHLRALSSAASIQVLPVGSNIRRKSDIDFSRKPGWAIVFGLQRTRVRALKKMLGGLGSLAATGCITKIISVGGNSDGQTNAEEHSLLESLKLREGFEQQGAQSESKISELMLTASFGIFGQDELSYSKSGSFMAYAGHGLNILVDFVGTSGAEPLCWMVEPRELLEGISQANLETRAERLRAWQQQTCSWELIASRLTEALELKAASPLPAQIASR